MTSRLLTPETLDHLKNLTLAARRVVEGFMAGLHRSPYHGFSVEFAEYREYLPGDDLRYFEWKTLGKSDRYYIKKFQSETNMRAQIMLDASASMGYASGPVTKLRWGAALAAALIHLMILQHDSVGLTAFGEKILARIPPARGINHQHQAFSILETLQPGGKTALSEILHRQADSLPNRSMVILISDLFEEVEEILDGIKHLTFKGHEVLVFQVLDPAEKNFPFTGLCEFQDLETGKRMQVLPEVVGEEVRAEMRRFLERMHQELAAQSVDLQEGLTSEPFDLFLAHYLHQRMRTGRWLS